MTKIVTKNVDPDKARQLLDTAPDWTRYDGLRIVRTTAVSIYLVMWGQLHWIPDPGTFNGLFRNWDGIVTSDYLMDSIPMGTPLSNMSFVAIANGSKAQYLVSMYRKHLIPDPGTAAQFNFKGPTTIPTLALEYIPEGNNVH